MRLTTWLLLAGLISPSARVAAQATTQQDSSFKNVEYLSGGHSTPTEKKGILVVSTTDVRLVGKNGESYLAIPLASIRGIADSTIVKQPKKSTLSGGANVGSGLGKVKGLFGKKGPEQWVILATEKEAAKDTIVFKTYEKEGARRIAAKVRARLGWPEPVAASAGAGAENASGNSQGADTASGPAPLMVVANPFAAEPADSEAAVQVGTAIRDEITSFVGDQFQVLTRKQMNTAIEPYGYSADAILSQSLVTELAKALQAEVVVLGDMKKGPDGKYAVTASLSTVGNTNATPVTTTQNDGESLADFGRRIADALKGPQPASAPGK